MRTKILLALAGLFIGQGAFANGVGSGGGGDRPGRAINVAYAAGCEYGPYVQRMEQDPRSDRNILRKVLYVCVNGSYFQDGRVPRYNRCREGEERFNSERLPRGNHDIDVKVPYTCVGGKWRRNP